MKKIFFFVTALFALVIYSDAQNISPYWSLSGNNNTGAGSKLGTTNLAPFRFFTNNSQRMIIDSLGRVGIGIASPVNILTVKSGGGTPAASWLNGLNSPIFMGFADGVSSEFVLAAANSLSTRRAVIQGRRSRGTLASPAAVVNNDFITSVLASGYDGTSFQNPATIDFFVDGTPTAGNVPARISFVTGSNATNRLERLKIGSTGNVDFNNGQVYLQQSNGFLGIGINAPLYKLHSEASSVAVYGNSTGGSYGVWGNSTYIGVYGTGTSYGTYGSSASSGYGAVGVGGTRGVYGYGTSYGLYGDGGDYGVYGSGASYGVYGYCSSNYAVYGNSYSGYGVVGSSYSNDGVYGSSSYLTGVYGYSSNYHGGHFYSATNNALWSKTDGSGVYAGVFEGNVYTYGAYYPSDKNLKKNIQDLNSAMSIIDKLKPKFYEYKDDGKYASMHLPKGNHYGLLAQELEEVLPDLVANAPHGLGAVTPKPESVKDSTKTVAVAQQNEATELPDSKAINYIELIPILIKGIQEQQTQIQELNTKNSDLQNQINDLKSLLSKGQNGTLVTSSNAFLKQNIPNPANNNTVISYYIPGNAGYAQIKITDIKGSLVKSFNAAKGEGKINIRTGELPAGTYNYTLYINNKRVDTKQMVVVE